MKGFKCFNSTCVCENNGKNLLIFIKTKVKFDFKILNPSSKFKKNSGKKNNFLLNSRQEKINVSKLNEKSFKNNIYSYLREDYLFTYICNL